MINPWLGIAIVLATFGAMLLALKLVERWLAPPAELVRKLMHVGMGLVVLSFPWLFDALWPAMLLATVATTLLLATKFVPALRNGIGTVLNGVNRISLGEVYFPIAVGLTLWLSDRDKILYCVPMLIMTLADTTAALIGLGYGRVRYVTSEGLKSAEGSIAFFAIAFLSVHVPLLLYTDIGRTQTLLIAVIIGTLSMLLEAVAWRGLDNLLIPIGAFAFLKLYETKSVHELQFRMIATLVMLLFALSWRRRSSLDDSALMVAALFGYGAWMLGGLIWLIGPALLFLVHVIVWPRKGERRVHSVFAVLAVIGLPMVWLALNVKHHRLEWLFAYAIAFGAHLAVSGTLHIEPDSSRRTQMLRLALCIVAGWMLAMLQCSTIPNVAVASLAAFIGICVTATLFLMVTTVIEVRGQSDAALHSTVFVTVMIGSAVAVGILFWQK